MARRMIAEGLLDRFRRPRAPAPSQAHAKRPAAVARPPRSGIARLIPGPKVVLALILLVLALGGGWLWLRDSSLVAVKKVQITGVTGANAAEIRRALSASARTMTTLDVRPDQLRMAVSPYPIVKRLEVATHFPHGLTIHVIEENPVGAVVVDGRTISVAGDGTLLPTVSATGLPTIPIKIPPGGTRVTDPTARGAVGILAAAPRRLLESISQVTTVSGHGLVVQVRNGPSLYFGDATQLGAKWQAATAVLADPGSAGAVYIDVTDPERPAAGAGSSGGAAGGSGGPSSSMSGG
jgi:cell division protein FtsQ